MGDIINKTISFHKEFDDIVDAFAEWIGDASVPVGKAIRADYKVRDEIRKEFGNRQFEDRIARWWTSPDQEEESTWERVARENRERIQERKQNKMKAKRLKAQKKRNKNR